MANVNGQNVAALDLYAHEALRRVARSSFGHARACLMDASSEARAFGEVVNVPIPRVGGADNFVGQNILAPAAAQTLTKQAVELTKSRFVQFDWTSEQVYDAARGGVFNGVLLNQIQQAIKTLATEIDTDCGNVQYQNACAAVGTGGTTPFNASASDPRERHLDEIADVRTAITRAGGTGMNRVGILSPTVAGAYSKSAYNVAVNQAGTAATRRLGVLGQEQSFQLEETTIPLRHTSTQSGAASINHSGGYAAGTTVLAVDGAGAASISVGDVFSVAGDATATKYVVTAEDATSVTIAAPGLRDAVADNARLTFQASYTPNVFTDGLGAILIQRAPKTEGSRSDITFQNIADPNSGMSFTLATVPGIGAAQYFVASVWGVAPLNTEGNVILLS